MAHPHQTQRLEDATHLFLQLEELDDRDAGAALVEGRVAERQIMKIFEYPTNMSWSNTPFTWNQISADPDSSSLSRQPHLIRMLGQKFQMTYGQVVHRQISQM